MIACEFVRAWKSGFSLFQSSHDKVRKNELFISLSLTLGPGIVVKALLGCPSLYPLGDIHIQAPQTESEDGATRE